MLTHLRAHLRDTLFWNTYLLVIMRVFGAGTGLLFWAWVARLMPPAEVGLASGAVSAATLIGGLAQLGWYGLVRHLAAQADPSPLINFSMLLGGLVSLGLALIFLGTLSWWTPALLPLRADPVMILMMVLLVVATALTQLMHWVFLAARRVSFSLWKMIIQSIAALALLPVFLPWMSGYAATIAAYMLSTVLGLIPSFWPFLTQAHPRYHFVLTLRPPHNQLSFAGYSLANYLADQLQRAPDTVLPLLILSVLGPSAGAYFFVVWTFGRSLPGWAGSLADSMFAEAAHAPGLTTLFARRSVRGGLLLSGALALTAIVLGGPVLALYGWAYLQNGFGLLIAVALATVPTVLLYSYVNIWRVRNQLRAVLIVTAMGVGSGIVFSLLGAHWAGLTGAGLGWLASQLLMALGLVVWLRKNYDKQLGF